MSLSVTITAGHTFTDETLEDADFAVPSASISDGLITVSEIDNALYIPRVTTLDDSSIINYSVISGRFFQAANVNISQNFTLKMHNVQDGMFGNILLFLSVSGTDTITPETTGYTDVIDGGLSAINISPGTMGARHILLWIASNGSVYWRTNQNLT